MLNIYIYNIYICLNVIFVIGLRLSYQDIRFHTKQLKNWLYQHLQMPSSHYDFEQLSFVENWDIYLTNSPGHILPISKLFWQESLVKFFYYNSKEAPERHINTTTATLTFFCMDLTDFIRILQDHWTRTETMIWFTKNMNTQSWRIWIRG